MCGIAGFAGLRDPARMSAMLKTLAHRGPDGEGIVAPEGEPFTFGHRRLSIIDLSPAGSQPMSDPSGRYWINYNGEVYNYVDLRRTLQARGRAFRSQTDTETVLAAYEAWGPGCLERLNGMFAFAIWDRAERTLFMARDHLGVKPLYYAIVGNALVYASEIKAIMKSGLATPQCDPDVLHNPWPSPASPRTGFKGVSKLPAAHSLTWRDGRATVRRWWTIAPREEDPGWHRASEDLTALVRDAVRQQMTSDVPIGALLSGGLDSSTIVALMSAAAPRPVRTFSIVFRTADRRLEAAADEGRYARLVARRFGCEHTEIEVAPDMVNLLPKIVWHLDEPIFDPAAINTYLIARTARENGTFVLLSGMGADEVFGGYRKYQACLLSERYQALVPEPVRRVIQRLGRRVPVASERSGLRLVRWGKRFLGFASLPPVERFLLADLSLAPEEYERLYADSDRVPYADLDEVKSRRAALGPGNLSYLTRMCLADTTLFLPDHNLAYMDKASMAAGVETRPPLIDRRLVEFMFGLGVGYRIRGRRQKALFRSVASQWIPRVIVNRPKSPFGAPLRAWIRFDMREMVDDLLSPASVKARGLYDPRTVQSLIREDREGREDHSHVIWNLLCREVWQRTVVEGAVEPFRTGAPVVRMEAGTAAAGVPRPGRLAARSTVRRDTIVREVPGRRSLLAIMQLPPPVHGVTMMNEAVLASEGVRRLFHVEVLPLRFAASMADLGHVSARKFLLAGTVALRLIAKCTRARPDLAYLTLVPVGFAYYRDLLLVAVLKLYRVPMVFHLHGKGIRSAAGARLSRRLYRWTFKDARVIHLSPLLYSDISEFVPPERCYFLPNGIADAAARLAPAARAAEAGPPHVVFLSNMKLEKGPIVLLRALLLLQERGIEFRASFAGVWVGDSCALQFSLLLEDRRLREAVRYVGAKYGAEKERLLQSADLFVFPTFHPPECFPLVILEAMSFALPIVTTAEGAIPDMVEDGVNGFLVPQRDAEALADRLAVLLTSRETRVRMGAKSRQKFEQRFRMETFESNITRIFRDVGGVPPREEARNERAVQNG